MARPMFAYRWSDGTWRDGPEPRQQQPAIQPQPKKQRKPQGFFKERNPQAVAQMGRTATFMVRVWLQSALSTAPLPANTVLRLAKEEGINEWALRRAKRHYGIKSLKVGGHRRGWGAKWIWQLPKA